MAEVLDAESLTTSSTQVEPMRFSSGLLASIIAQERWRVRSGGEDWRSVQPDLVFMIGPSKYMVIETKIGDTAVREDAASLASSFKEVAWLPFRRQDPNLGPAAESSTATTERFRPQLRRMKRRNELLRRLTPERRATYERIKKLREEVGPVGFDVVEELRDLRENG